MEMNRKNGQALVLVCLVIVFLVILTVPLFNIILSERNILEREKLEKEAFYAAEGAMEDTINQFISDVANFQAPADTAIYPVSGTPRTTYYNTAHAASSAFPSGGQATSLVTEAESGMRTITEGTVTICVKNYIVTSTCTHPANSNITITLKRAFTLREIAAFQHAVFYNDVLELLPGAPMTFSGRIHANDNIYIASNGSTLTIDSDYLCSAGNIYNKQLSSTILYTGAVNIKVAGSTNFHNMYAASPSLPLDCDNPNWSSYSQDSSHGWNGTVKSSIHGVTKLAVPVVGSIQPDGYYADNAGLKIVGSTITRNGVALTQSNTPGPNVIPLDTVTWSNTLNDQREGHSITTTNVDLKKLAGWTTTNGVTSQTHYNNLPLNGLIYSTSSSSNTPVTYTATRLINGSTIYSNNVYVGNDSAGQPVTSNSGGLTIVSNDPVYIQGNYNSSSKKPSAVICDSVDILSNNWSDSNSGSPIGSRTATGTTVNTAFIAGVDTTTTGHYNGGLENYPRLLENWSGSTLTITGCFIELWHSSVARGAWPGTGSVYNPPTRTWSYDSSFASGSSLPPFTPHAIEAQRSTWWKQ